MSSREAESIQTAPRDGTWVRVLHGPLSWRPRLIGTERCEAGCGSATNCLRYSASIRMSGGCSS